MNPVSRLIMELRLLRASLRPKDYNRYIGYLITKAPKWVKMKTLAPVDHSMSGHIPFKIGGKTITIPLDEIWGVLSKYDQTTTFGGAREMYASNVYLRAFQPNLRAKNVIDLGSNRGLFLMLAATVLEAEQCVGVEPENYYAPVFKLLSDANTLGDARLHRIYKFASAKANENTITMQAIIDDYNMPVIDFLKCDIEGGEFDVFFSNNDFLNKVNNLSMELHPSEGDVAKLVEILKNFKFEVNIVDQFNSPVNVQNGNYLYASRIGSLL